LQCRIWLLLRASKQEFNECEHKDEHNDWTCSHLYMPNTQNVLSQKYCKLRYINLIMQSSRIIWRRHL